VAQLSLPSWALMLAARLMVTTLALAGLAGQASAYPSLAASRGPAVHSLRATPEDLPAGGGTVVVTARVNDATACQLMLLSHPPSSVVYRQASRACSSHSFSATVALGPNRSPSQRMVALALFARADGQSVADRFYVLLAGTEGAATVALPRPADVPSPAASSLPPSVVRSSNWAGYAATGGPYTVVTGTFSVPRLAAGTPFYDRVAEWVGIDGASSSDSSLIQAGVSEYSDPVGSTGFDVEPWWEILPDPVTNITSVAVQAGQRVTVTIWELAGTKWEIDLTDDNNGEKYATPPQQYDGPRSSAEWIVEATTTCSYGCLTAVPPLYTPGVVFDGLGMTGREVALDEDTMVKGKMSVSTPSALRADRFTVTCTSGR
jgi:Peptidase A4 family